MHLPGFLAELPERWGENRGWNRRSAEISDHEEVNINI